MVGLAALDVDVVAVVLLLLLPQPASAITASAGTPIQATSFLIAKPLHVVDADPGRSRHSQSRSRHSQYMEGPRRRRAPRHDLGARPRLDLRRTTRACRVGAAGDA